MINKSRLLVVATVTLLAACVSDDDLTHVQSQVSRLQGKVSHLEGQLAQSKEELALTKGELAVVKEQRVVRLPTGAPMETRARNRHTPNDNSGTPDSDAAAFNTAVQQYKSGDVQGAIVAFDEFNRSYPNSRYRSQSLFYLGQAAYTLRDYYRAQQALEPLVFQPVNGRINEPAARLLALVYQAQGNNDDKARLAEYVQSLSQSPASSSSSGSGVSAINTTNVPTTAQQVEQTANGVIIESNIPSATKPLRPNLIRHQ